MAEWLENTWYTKVPISSSRSVTVQSTHTHARAHTIRLSQILCASVIIITPNIIILLFITNLIWLQTTDNNTQFSICSSFAQRSRVPVPRPLRDQRRTERRRRGQSAGRQPARKRKQPRQTIDPVQPTRQTVPDHRMQFTGHHGIPVRVWYQDRSR